MNKLSIMKSINNLTHLKSINILSLLKTIFKLSIINNIPPCSVQHLCSLQHSDFIDKHFIVALPTIFVLSKTTKNHISDSWCPHQDEQDLPNTGLECYCYTSIFGLIVQLVHFSSSVALTHSLTVVFTSYLVIVGNQIYIIKVTFCEND